MGPLKICKYISLRNSVFTIVAVSTAFLALQCSRWDKYPPALIYASTVAGTKHEFGEPFGVAVKGADIYVSDGEKGLIWLIRGGEVIRFAVGLATPSGMA